MSEIGFAAWSFGAQKGVYQPPYCLKYRGRWWRTLPLTAPLGEACLGTVEIDALHKIARLPHGARRCMDNLVRTNRRFADLPLINPIMVQP